MLTLALAASVYLAAAPAVLTVEIKPAQSELLIDGVKKGKGDKPIVVKLKPGKHLIKVVYKGDSTSEEIELKAGEKKTWKWEFTGVDGPKPAETPTPEAE